MYKLLLVGSGNDTFAKVAKALQENLSVEFKRAESGNSALDRLLKEPVDLVVAAEQLADMSGLAFAAKLVVQNPMVNCALVSSLDDDDFHEASEGLGILAKLPTDPDETQAAELLQKLRIIMGPHA
jgi:CheY-like chemotaxis protein